MTPTHLKSIEDFGRRLVERGEGKAGAAIFALVAEVERLRQITDAMTKVISGEVIPKVSAAPTTVEEILGVAATIAERDRLAARIAAVLARCAAVGRTEDWDSLTLRDDIRGILTPEVIYEEER